MNKTEELEQLKTKYMELRNELATKGYTKDEAMEYIYYDKEYKKKQDEKYDTSIRLLNYGSLTYVASVFLGLIVSDSITSMLYLAGTGLMITGISKALYSKINSKQIGGYKLMKDLENKVEKRSKATKIEFTVDNRIEEYQYQCGTDGKLYDKETLQEVGKVFVKK